MQNLADVSRLLVSQKKEWAEIITGFETKNSYVIRDEMGQNLYYAAEQSGFILRNFLKSLRPFEMAVADLKGQEVFHLKRPFKFYFHELQIFDAAGTLMGTIKRKFSLIRRNYVVLDATGQERFDLFGPFWHPWTFNIRKGTGQYGKITKKWSGLGKEIFTDADNFGVEFPGDWDVSVKAIFLGAIFLIDIVHFEANNGNRGGILGDLVG